MSSLVRKHQLDEPLRLKVTENYIQLIRMIFNLPVFKTIRRWYNTCRQAAVIDSSLVCRRRHNKIFCFFSFEQCFYENFILLPGNFISFVYLYHFATFTR